jgi:MFS family permease
MITLPLDNRVSLQMAKSDGRLCLFVLSLGLTLSGLAALFLAAVGRFLPHDERFLGMTARDLCAIQGCRIVHFMIHDRAAFGGALVAVGVLYAWLVQFPLRRRQRWAWWALAASGAVGFASFFAYLGFGYLDVWHGAASLALAPCYIFGLAKSHAVLLAPDDTREKAEVFVRPPWRSAQGVGRACLLAAAVGLTAAGLTILIVGMTCVFVPQDLTFLGFKVGELQALNPRLVPLIAHDRAGFGGAVGCFGVALGFSVWRATFSRSFWFALAIAGAAIFGAAIGVHFAVGYTDATHLGPAFAGAMLYLAGLVLTCREDKR